MADPANPPPRLWHWWPHRPLRHPSRPDSQRWRSHPGRRGRAGRQIPSPGTSLKCGWSTCRRQTVAIIWTFTIQNSEEFMRDFSRSFWWDHWDIHGWYPRLWHHQLWPDFCRGKSSNSSWGIHMKVSKVMGVPQASWMGLKKGNIPSRNGWWLGVALF